ncbi:MAG: GIDE domain-containing protein [Nanoarchaeota archaeon]
MGSDGRILVYSLVGLVVGIYLFISGFKWFRQKRTIENMPTSKVRSLAMGLVEVYGKAMPYRGKMFKSPFSSEKCLWCRWTVEEYRSNGKHSSWVTVRNGVMSNYFLLDDGTGEVVVDPDGAKIDIPMDNEFKSRTFNRNLTKSAITFLASQNYSHTTLFGLGKDIRLREYFIAPDDKLYVIGTAGDNPLVEEATAQKNEADIMIQRGKDFYFISDTNEREVVAKFNLKVFGGLVGGSTLILGSLAVIFWFLGML